MAFINEFVSDKDVEKYQLDKLINDLWDDPFRKLPSVGYRHSWTIDKERDFFLIMVGAVEDVGVSGRSEPTGVVKFLLNVNGILIEFQLKHSSGSSKDVRETSFIMVWDLINEEAVDGSSSVTSDHRGILKEALLVYAYDGAGFQVLNASIEFNF